ncbi:isochorismatase family protein [Alteromonas sp. C1M14]|uniref:isochorismatase family protein n=1 Tax=Alteromonas sp. C1M14 TaxID=2841567 RepID=UPI0020919B69|nr:isochorismatase family protein [Alteromonas sp. C1M14]
MNKNNTGLLIVDIQGNLARQVHDSHGFITRCETLIKGAKILGLPIIILEQNPEKLGSTIEEIRLLLPDQPRLAKYTFDGCLSDSLMEALQFTEVENWLVCGIEAHVCVYQTAKGMAKAGLDVHMVSDCIASRSAENHALAISKCSALGLSITGLEMCLFELVKDCRADEFKPILILIK